MSREQVVVDGDTRTRVGVALCLDTQGVTRVRVWTGTGDEIVLSASRARRLAKILVKIADIAELS